MKSQAVTDTAVQLNQSTDVHPFVPGRNAVVHNTTAGSLTLQGSSDGTTYSTLATVGAGAYANVTLPNYVKVSTAATLYLLAGA
ncbi:hypothetical protein [Lysobacter olei]